MPLVSVIMPCYNADKYLRKSVNSLIEQTFKNWELVIVDDGSTDRSVNVGEEISVLDNRVKIVRKSNGGYVSARLYGLRFISENSKYLLFYDADDILHPEMLEMLVGELEKDDEVGAAYCDHRVMDENDVVKENGIDMPRFTPSRFWVKKLPNEISETPFISIFCWTKMIEPMTVIRRTSYEQTPGWDLSFGKGQGNIGEGVYLFSEIALKWKIKFVNKPLYYYRRHSQQMSATSSAEMERQVVKVINKWRDRLADGMENEKKIELAIHFLIYRLKAYKRCGSMKHLLRYKPLWAVRTSFLIAYEWIMSLNLVFSYKRLLND